MQYSGNFSVNFAAFLILQMKDLSNNCWKLIGDWKEVLLYAF